MTDLTVKKVISSSAAQTKKLGQKLAKQLRGGEVLALSGDLGSGKTTFIKGLAKGLGVKQTITSPTFVLFKVYPVKHRDIRHFVHVDCYRVRGAELNHIGLADYLGEPHTVVAIEWAEKLKQRKPTTMRLIFTLGKRSNERRITIKKPTRY